MCFLMYTVTGCIGNGLPPVRGRSLICLSCAKPCLQRFFPCKIFRLKASNHVKVYHLYFRYTGDEIIEAFKSISEAEQVNEGEINAKKLSSVSLI